MGFIIEQSSVKITNSICISINSKLATRSDLAGTVPNFYHLFRQEVHLSRYIMSQIFNNIIFMSKKKCEFFVTTKKKFTIFLIFSPLITVDQNESKEKNFPIFRSLNMNPMPFQFHPSPVLRKSFILFMVMTFKFYFFAKCFKPFCYWEYSTALQSFVLVGNKFCFMYCFLVGGKKKSRLKDKVGLFGFIYCARTQTKQQHLCNTLTTFTLTQYQFLLRLFQKIKY